MGLVVFSYSAAMHLAPKQLSFKLVYGVYMLQVVDLALVGHIQRSSLAKMFETRPRNMNKLLLEKAQN